MHVFCKFLYFRHTVSLHLNSFVPAGPTDPRDPGGPRSPSFPTRSFI